MKEVTAGTVRPPKLDDLEELSLPWALLLDNEEDSTTAPKVDVTTPWSSSFSGSPSRMLKKSLEEGSQRILLLR